MGDFMMWKRQVVLRWLRALTVMSFLGALLVYALWPWLLLPNRPDRPRTVVFYGFSILGEAMNTGIFPEFKKERQARTGQSGEFISSPHL
jgi:hypothetical protein